MERRDLLHELVGELLAGNHRHAGNVVDRLFRIELGALAARPVEDVDHVAFEVEETELEDGEKPDRARADDDNIRFYRVSHCSCPQLMEFPPEMCAS